MKKAFVNACLYPISGPRIERGALLVSGGKIAGIVNASDVPSEYKATDVSGKTILPGFVDEHTHVGVWAEHYGPIQFDGNESTNPVTPEVSSRDAIWPEHSAFSDARSGGVTTAQITPGSGNIIGGEMVVVKMRGTIIDDMIIKNPSGQKAALGENPKNAYGNDKKTPKTRMGNAAVMRGAFLKARDYQRKLDLGRSDPTKIPDTDLGMLNLLKVLRREVPLRIHAHRADDIVTGIRVAEEFGFDYSIEHCTDGIAIAPFLGQRKAKVNVGPSMWHRAKNETYNISFRTPGVLAEAGCHVSIISDHPFHPVQYLSTAAALAWANGMKEEEALKAVTLNPAQTLGVSDRVGSLSEGKDADFVIWSGHPFRIRSKVEAVYIEGEEVYRRAM